jgi:acyl-CoA oxidase
MLRVLTAFDSALGVSDGRVYEAVWQRVQMEPMNKDQVTPAYAVRLSSILRGLLLNRIFELCCNVDTGQGAAEQKMKLKGRF